ncbi:MAG: GNAT family N-acetyltransferase [Leptolyngbya sp. PLA1]|nr:GNAT family N-acetyltransferase [Leptolyngbya sp. PLA1]
MSRRTPTQRVDVRVASSPSDLDLARTLFREYAASLPFSLCFQGFEEELATLPGKYAAPAGEILIAYDTRTPVGCVALRPIDPLPDDPSAARPVCEMKRLYVKPASRGLGAGRALCERLIADARVMGYRMMKLDSEPDFDAAVGLYRSLGFVPIPRYNDDPHPQTIYLGLRL